MTDSRGGMCAAASGSKCTVRVQSRSDPPSVDIACNDVMHQLDRHWQQERCRVVREPGRWVMSRMGGAVTGTASCDPEA